MLVVEGSIPNEALKGEGYWCGFGNDPTTGQPMTTSEWLDRLAPKALAVLAVGTCATYGGIHAMAGNPTGAMGVPDYLGWDWKSKAGIPIVCVPGCPIQPDNLSETITYLLYQATGQAPMIPLDDALRPQWLFGATVHEGCDRAGYYEQGDFADRVRLAEVHRQARLLGPGGEVQRAQARLDQRRRRLPERRRHLHRLHDAGLPRQVHAVHGRAAGRQVSTTASGAYGATIRALRGDHRQDTLDKEPKWRKRGQRAAHRREADLVSGERADDHDGNHDDGTRVGSADDKDLVEMAWDPITRIVGSLGHLHEDRLRQPDVAECHSTSSIFRGY